MKSVLLVIIILIVAVVILKNLYDEIYNEIDTLKMYCRDNAKTFNYYKPHKKEYVGKKYNNTNTGEIIIITDVYYQKESGYLFLKGKTRSGRIIEAPFTHFSWNKKNKSGIHPGVMFDLKKKKKI